MFKIKQSGLMALEVNDYLRAWKWLLGGGASGNIVPLDLGSGEPDAFIL